MDISIDLSKLTWTDVIAFYASIVATSALILEGVRLNREYKTRLIVEIYPPRFPVEHMMNDRDERIRLIIINDSSRLRYIRHPSLHVKMPKYEKPATLRESVVGEEIQYPIPLHPGESHQCFFSARSKLLENAMIWGGVADTLGNVYTSKRVIIQP